MTGRHKAGMRGVFCQVTGEVMMNLRIAFASLGQLFRRTNVNELGKPGAKPGEFLRRQLPDRLLDFESYVVGSQRVYSGVFSPGNDARGAWFGKEWENFISQWHNFEKGGLRLTDLEIYEASCGSNCTDQLVMPACPGDPDCAYNYGITATSTHCEGKPGTCPSPGTGDTVLYRQPLQMNGNQRLIRLSAVDIKDQLFTLPVEQISSMGHNGWRYSSGD